jgi:hypothetical protein
MITKSKNKLLPVVAALFLAACSKDNPSPSNPSPNPGPTPTPNPTTFTLTGRVTESAPTTNVGISGARVTLRISVVQRLPMQTATTRSAA